MSMTEYIRERAEVIERESHAKLDIISALLPTVAACAERTERLPRTGGLLVLLLRMQAELTEEKAAALRVIESALELRRNTKDLQ